MAKFRGTNNTIGAWHYVLLDILYMIPVIGWIALLIHALDKGNETRMHYARSRILHVVIWLLIFVILFIVLYFTGANHYFDNQEAANKIIERYQPQFQTLFDNMNEELSNIPTN